jgi:hypothetical protein
MTPESLGHYQISRLAIEPLWQFRIGGKMLRQHLGRYVPAQPGVSSAVHFTHAAGTNRRDNFIRT